MEPDNEYVKARNKLIPFAEIYANKKHGEAAGDQDREIWTALWNSAFSGEMDRLARKEGLV